MTPRAIIPVAALALAVTACSASVNTEPDEVAIAYSAAAGSATTFDKCVPASHRDGISVHDNTWTYPAGQRTFDFTGAQGAESKPLTVVSKDNVQLSVPGFATFALNTAIDKDGKCPTLRLFHERIGLKYRAFFYGTDTDADSSSPDESGWVRMLNVYFRQPLDRAMDAASQEFSWRELYNDPAAKQRWEARVGQLAGQFITESAGGPFFCAPNFTGAGQCGDIVLTLQKPQPPQNLVDALAASEAAKAQNLAQQQINTRVETELESMRKLVGLLGPHDYVLLQAVNKGQVSFVVDGKQVAVEAK
jgi:hypothetical protein